MKRGTVISVVGLINGIGTYASLHCLTVEDTTGLYDTSYENKVTVALDALKTDDFIYLHIEVSDEADREGDVSLKTRAIENLDSCAVGPVYEAVKNWGKLAVIAILPDHPTPCELRAHTSESVPFFIWYPGIEPGEVQIFNEAAACSGSYGMMKKDEFTSEFMKEL